MAGTRAALIEGEEPGLLPGESGGHGHVVWVDGEMHERAAGEDQVGRVAIGAVLLARVVDVLPGEGVLQLGRGDGNAVDHERHVE